MANGIGVDMIPDELRSGKVGANAIRAMQQTGPNLVAVCTVELPVTLTSSTTRRPRASRCRGRGMRA
jgi:hypothetical protein